MSQQTDQDNVLKQHLTQTDKHFPATQKQENFCCLPYGYILQPFNKYAPKVPQNHHQRLLRCQKCSAAFNCFNGMNQKQLCLFCGEQQKIELSMLATAEMQEIQLNSKITVRQHILIMIDVSTSRGFEFLNQIMEIKLLDRIHDVMPDLYLLFGFYSTQVHFLHIFGPEKYEIMTFVEDVDVDSIPHVTPPLTQILFTLKSIFTNKLFTQQLKQLIVEEQRNITNSISIGFKLLSYRQKHNQNEEYINRSMYIIAFGPDMKVNPTKNQKDFNYVKNQYIQESLISMIPDDDVKQQLMLINQFDVSIKLYFQTNEYVDATNYSWLCNKHGDLNIYEMNNAKFFSDFIDELLSSPRKKFNVKIQTQISNDCYNVRHIIGRGQKLSPCQHFCLQCDDNTFFVLELEHNKHCKMWSKIKTAYIQITVSYINGQGQNRQRIFTKQITFAESDKELVQNYNVLAKLTALHAICASNIEPLVVSADKQSIELNFGYIAFYEQLSEKIPIFVRNIQPLIEQEADRSLQLTQLLRGVFNITHTNLFAKNLSNVDDRVLCAHKSICAAMDYVVNLIIPQILICPKFKRHTVKQYLEAKAQGNLLLLNRFQKMYYQGYADLAILAPKSQFSINNGYVEPSVAVVLNKRQTRVFIIVDDNDIDEDVNIEFQVQNSEISEDQSSAPSQSRLVTKFSNSVSNLHTNSRKSSVNGSIGSARDVNVKLGLSKYSSRLSVYTESTRHKMHEPMYSDSDHTSNELSVELKQVNDFRVRFDQQPQSNPISRVMNTQKSSDVNSSQETCKPSSFLYQPNVKAAVKQLQKHGNLDEEQVSVKYTGRDCEEVRQLMYESAPGGIDDWMDKLFNLSSM